MKAAKAGVIIFAAVVLLGALPAFALPAGFTDQSVVAGLSLPIDFVHAPDGRIFIAEKNGDVVVFKNGQLLETPALRMAISTGGDRGLLSLALDPNFSSNGFVYLLYTTISNHQRISRFTMAGDTIQPAGELVLLENPRTWSGFLNAGSLRFGTDGKLYASFGSDGQGAAAQDLSALEGKLVRINPDGSIPVDNPFAGTPGAQRSIFAYGFRNPWKFNFDQSGRVIVGDVGEDRFEKIARVVSGGNFGWPNFEGDCRPSCGGVTPPLYVYAHEATGGAAVVGGSVYTGSSFPTRYHGVYFFGDYVGGYIKTIFFDESNNVSAVEDFAADLGALAGINSGPDGCLYYLIIFPGEIRKICHGAPTSVSVAASADKQSGLLPLTVQFNAAGAGAGLQYRWDFGDGSTNTLQNPSHTYTAEGVYQARVTAENSTASSTSNITIWAGRLPPSVTITAPVIGSTWNAGDAIFFEASAGDPQEGTLPAANITWKIIFHHNTHIHAPEDVIGQYSGTFVIPNHLHTAETDIGYEFEVTATNSVGLSSTTSRTIFPNTMTFRLGTSPSGLGLLLDDQPINTPYEAVAVPGYERKISAPSPQIVSGTSYEFLSWSNGGGQIQTFVMSSASTAISANFATTTAPTFSTVALLGQETYSTGSALTGTVSVVGNISRRVLLDIEIWGAEKVNQIVVPIDVVAGQESIVNLNTGVPGTPGTYKMKVGIFSPDWATLYHWNDFAESFLIEGEVLVPLSFAAAASTSKSSYSTSEQPAITSSVVANQTRSSLLLDTEIWGPAGKVAQQIVPMSVEANTEFASLWNAPAFTAGTYTVKLGIFSSDWSILYKWIDSATTFTVVASSSPPAPAPTPAFAVSASIPQTAFPPGSTTTIATSVTATGDVPDVIVDTEIFDINGNKVGQRVVSTSLAANRQFQTQWSATLPSASGTYLVKIGVFSSDWSRLYIWKNNAFQFTIGSAPGEPVPGQMYPITMYVPEDNGTVSGVVEIKAAIPELNIHSYNIDWRTGGGEFFTLDTDPVTQGFKHAWIDFGPWTWRADNTYPLEFQATDMHGNVIGGRTIHVRVAR